MASPRLTEPILQRSDWHCCGNGANDELDRSAFREQVDRILASPVFRNSRRNSSLLRHVVERTLEGRPDELKERSIGVDVFAKAVDYDTNTDHVVRSVAGEVRRRLAQYYMEPGRETELRIDLQAGSYIPQFRMPVERYTISAAIEEEQPFQPVEQAPRRWQVLGRRRTIFAAAALMAIAAASLLLVRFIW